MFKSIAAAALALAALSSTAGAATYTDRASFEAATTGVTNHTTPAVAFTPSFSFDGMTFAQLAPGGTIGTQRNYSALFTNELAINGIENFTVSFASPVYGFGMDLAQAAANGSAGPCGLATCFEATIETASGPGGTVNFVAAIGALTFIGFTFETGITSISFVDQTADIGDEFFGNFVTASALAPVPVPAAGLLLLGGVAALGALRRRG